MRRLMTLQPGRERYSIVSSGQVLSLHVRNGIVDPDTLRCWAATGESARCSVAATYAPTIASTSTGQYEHWRKQQGS